MSGERNRVRDGRDTSLAARDSRRVRVPNGDGTSTSPGEGPPSADGSAAIDRLAALEERDRNEDVFFDCERQAREWISKHGTQALVDELREARAARRRVKLGTPNTLILLAHIDRLEAELAKEPYRG